MGWRFGVSQWDEGCGMWSKGFKLRRLNKNGFADDKKAGKIGENGEKRYFSGTPILATYDPHIYQSNSRSVQPKNYSADPRDDIGGWRARGVSCQCKRSGKDLVVLIVVSFLFLS